MPITPTWQAATSGQTAHAGHINQLLAGHAATILYAGTQTAAQAAAGATTTTSNGLYIAQSFTTAAGQTAVGYVQLTLTGNNASGANLGSITVSLYANSGGAPAGSPIVTTTVTTEYAWGVTGGTTTIFVTIPLPATVTASTTYWIVTAPAGNATYNYSWHRSNQTSGASTSANGTAWTAQTYGLQYKVFDQTAAGPIACTWEDAGARWTATTWNSSQQIATYAEYTAGQTAAGYLQSYRTYTYSAGRLSAIA